MIRLSVIIPIYNASKYLSRSVGALMRQTLTEGIEFIFVNDASTDDSLSVLNNTIESFPSRREQVKIINLEKNSGVACARRTGMVSAQGEFLIHCDADDWVDEDLYEKMLDAQRQRDADIVTADFCHEFGDSYKVERFIDTQTPQESLSKDEWWTLWSKMVRRSLIEKYELYPIDGCNYMEDVWVLMRVFYYAQTIDFVHNAFYHYNRSNESSLMHTSLVPGSLRKRSENLIRIENFFLDKHEVDVSDFIQRHKLSYRDMYLSQRPIDFCNWRNTFPETVNYVVHNSTAGVIYKLCYILAHKGFSMPLRLILH